MSLIHLTASEDGLVLEGRPARCGPAGMVAALEATPKGAPVVILIHGFSYDPSPAGLQAGRDPHSLMYGRRFGDDAPPAFAPCADWPAGLGFATGRREAGLCIGFGWPAHAGHWRSLLRHGRNGLAEAYRRAGEAGALLGELIATLHAIRPDLAFDMLAHSLGARVALAALGAPGVGRAILLGAAEYASVAHARAAEAPGASVYNIVSRQNDPFDLAFEMLTPGPSRGALGRAGLGPRANWIDLQLDNPDLEQWLACRGRPLGPHDAPVSHWSFYTREGAMPLYRAMLRDRAAWSISALRAAAAPEEIAPRWSRLLPPVRAPQVTTAEAAPRPSTP